MALVTPEQVLAHLRIDSPDEAAVYVGAAEERVMAILNRNVYEDADSLAAAVLANVAGDDPIVVTKTVQAAILLIAGHLYRNREDVITGQGAAAVQLPSGALSLLYPLRVGMGV